MKPNAAIDNLYYIGLLLVKGIAYAQAQKLVCRFGTAKSVFHASIKDTIQLCNISYNVAERIVSQKTLELAESLLEEHEKSGVKMLTPWDSGYPFRLKEIPDAPPILFCKGEVDLLNHTRIVSVVGTRASTSYGLKAIKNIINDLSDHNVLIVSGLAYGVDIAAHRAALESKLPTVAVYAGGIDMVYPKEHSQIASNICEKGALVTEYPIGTSVETYQFPARNRIIAGMSDAVIIVEAPERSGALITASYANDYDREVFAVPGNIYDKNSIGCHNLILNNQARIITSAKDLLSIMNWDSNYQNKKQVQLEVELPQSLSEEESVVFKSISGPDFTSKHIDDLSDSLNLPINKLSGVLLKLEMSGKVVSLPGKRYKVA